MDRLLTDEQLADLMNEECPDKIARLVIRVRNLQDAKTLKAIIQWMEKHASFHSDDHMAYMRLSWDEWQILKKGKI